MILNFKLIFKFMGATGSLSVSFYVYLQIKAIPLGGI